MGSPARAAAHRPLAAAPPSTTPHVDRSARPWVPLYLDLIARALPDGRPGADTGPGPAMLYSLIVQRQGTPQLGRRPSAAERDGREKFSPNPITSTEILRRFAVSHDQLQNWETVLAGPRPCAACERAHPMIRVQRRPGFPKRYTLLQCSDVAPGEAIPIARAVRRKRAKTGGAPADRADGLFDGAPAPSEEVRGSAERSQTTIPPRAGVSEKVRDLAASGGSSDPPSIAEARLIALVGISALEGVSAPPEILDAIAQNVETTDVAALRDALLHVVAASSIQHETLSPAFVSLALREREILLAASPPHGAAGNDGGLHVLPNDHDPAFLRNALLRVLELARRTEPETTPTRARRYRDEIVAAITERFGQRTAAERTAGAPAHVSNEIIERELFRILSDPRVVGRPDDRTKKPIALIRDGLRTGWIWVPADADTDGHRLTRAFQKLSPGIQSAVLRIFEEYHATREPLPRQRLAQLGVTSRAMIDHLTVLTRPPT